MPLKVIRSLWWLFVAYVPFAIHRIAGFLSGYSCPPKGDCYNFAALARQDLESLFVISAIAIWPVCIWHLGLRAVVKKLSQHKAQRKNP